MKVDNPNLKIFVFDDTYEKHFCDILLNHNVYADKDRYKGLVPDGCEIRYGSKYTLIRDEFLREKKITREKKYDFFVAMGGADTLNLTTRILKLIPENKKVSVITTKANAHLSELQRYVKFRKNIDLFVNSTKVAELMNMSKFAIVTPSVIVHEILYLGIPFLAIKTAQNQKFMIEFLSKKGYLNLDEFNTLFLKKHISKMEE